MRIGVLEVGPIGVLNVFGWVVVDVLNAHFNANLSVQLIVDLGMINALGMRASNVQSVLERVRLGVRSRVVIESLIGSTNVDK